MKNNWKDKIQKDLDEGKFYSICSNENTFKKYAENLLAEQKKELKEEALAREKLLVDMHRIELDAISCMSLERFIKWSDDRKNKESLKHHD